MKKPAAVYRPILKKAFHTAWSHREFWLIGALAGLAGTGTVLNDLLTQAKNAIVLPEQSATEYFGILQYFKVYFSVLIQADPTNAFGSFLLFAGAFLFVVLMVIAAQHVILRSIHRAAGKKQHLSLKELLHDLRHPRFGRMLLINAFFKLMITNLLIASGLLLREFNSSTIVADAFFGGIFALVAIALTFSMNIMSIFSLIETTRKDVTLFDALYHAYKTLRAHPIVCFEMSTLLFGINFLLTLSFILTLAFAATPVYLLFAAAIQTGSLILITLETAFVSLALLTFTIAFAGFVTTFTYSAWTELSYKILRVKKLSPRLHKHGKNLLGHFAKSS